MNGPENSVAFGAPGIEPRWTSSAKEGVGTAYHNSCRVWFTLSHGIVNEIYYPHVDQPNTRAFQYLISDGETFCHEEKRDLDHVIEYPERDCVFYRLTNSEPGGRYRVVKYVFADPHQSVLLVHTKVEVLDESLRGKLRLYSLLAPHIAGYGAGNSGWCSEVGNIKLIRAQRENVNLIMACTTGFSRRSVGYVGFSDGWQDLMDNFQMDWEFRTAEEGNIALTGEIHLPPTNEFTVAVAFGRSYQSTTAKLFQSLAEPFESHRQAYVRQWQRAVVNPKFDFSADTSDGGGMYRLSRCVLIAHEDKVFQGAIVASMSIPWGETKGDNDLGGYHLVWTRDLVKSATALLATGQTGTPLRALIWLAAIQRPDGSFPQNSWIDGTAYWSGLQLDQVALPILLAWRLHKQDALGLFNPRVMIVRAAARLILQGPVTAQDRWEENAGYSPSTLATVIAALVCAAEWATEYGLTRPADFVFAYADWLVAHLEEWTVTTNGELVEGFPRHYIRINPSDPSAPDPHADPNTTMIQLANGGGLDPKAFIAAMEDFADQGGMISEQLWDRADLPDGRMKRGCPTGAAMPLCWSHAEYVSLVRSRHDGVCFDRVEPAFRRYLLNPVQSRYEIWSLRHPLRRVSRGKILRLILAVEATIVWSTDEWARTNESDTSHESTLNLWFADFPTEDWPEGSALTFTLFWKRDQRWEGRTWRVDVF